MEKGDKQIHDQPILIELEPGTYNWCRDTECSQPICDSSHKEHGENWNSIEFKVEEKTKMAICTCKHTNNEPNCDGSHAKQS